MLEYALDHCLHGTHASSSACIMQSYLQVLENEPSGCMIHAFCAYIYTLRVTCAQMRLARRRCRVLSSACDKPVNSRTHVLKQSRPATAQAWISSATPLNHNTWAQLSILKMVCWSTDGRVNVYTVMYTLCKCMYIHVQIAVCCKHMIAVPHSCPKTLRL